MEILLVLKKSSNFRWTSKFKWPFWRRALAVILKPISDFCSSIYLIIRSTSSFLLYIRSILSRSNSIFLQKWDRYCNKSLVCDTTDFYTNPFFTFFTPIDTDFWWRIEFADKLSDEDAELSFRPSKESKNFARSRETQLFFVGRVIRYFDSYQFNQSILRMNCNGRYVYTWTLNYDDCK